MTDIGRRRDNNEDAVLHMPEQGVFCVADGMGGGDAGELASQWTVDHIREEITKRTESGPLSLEEKTAVARNAVGDANERIREHSFDEGMRGCGTTAVVAVLDESNPATAVVFHVGDSRAYLFREGKLTQLTNDHSFAAAAGVRNDALLPAFLQNMITRAVGISDSVALDETTVDLETDDLLILCSDGLTRMLSDRRIRKLVEFHRQEGPDQVVKALVDTANDEGGLDNISVVVVAPGA